MIRSPLQFFILILLLAVTAPFEISAAPSEEKQDINLLQAQHSLEKYLSQIKNNLTIPQLESSVEALQELHKEAETCIGNYQQQASTVKEQIEQLAESNPQDNTFLLTRQAQFTAQLAKCQLLQLQLDEAIVLYEEKLAQALQTQLYNQQPPLWQVVSVAINKDTFSALTFASLQDKLKLITIPIDPMQIGGDAIAHGIYITLLFFTTLALILILSIIKPKIRLIKKSFYPLILALLIINIIAWFGYLKLAQHVLYALVMSVLLFSFVLWMQRYSDYLFRWPEKLYRLFGFKHHDSLPEIIALKVLYLILLWGGLLLGVVKLWEVTDQDFYDLLTATLQGFHLFGFHIVPAKIIIAILIFILLMLITRLLKQHITNGTQTGNIHPSARYALTTLIGYVGYGLAGLVSLIVAGVNFTGLALIIGGLSVGIGMGLKDIVNNFFSGIILLLERPIKRGDRVLIGTTEGFVKKISIRATQISTLHHTDLIVPNSELIASQVTNLMFKDNLARITVKVGVAYGSDTELVRKVLLQVAEQEERVVNDKEGLAPRILFREFGDSSLNFELWCIIHDVNAKYDVLSDLHLAIDSAFRKHGIVIAFPQRDLHVKNWPGNDLK